MLKERGLDDLVVRRRLLHATASDLTDWKDRVDDL
jgi:hypothetical protein